jgi:hypothetical protein
VAKSYYELQKEQERLALMGLPYVAPGEDPIQSMLPNAVDAKRMAHESSLNVLGERLAASRRVDPRTPQEQADIDQMHQDAAVVSTGERYDAVLGDGGKNRGSGLLGYFGRRKLKKNRAEREPLLQKALTEKARIADQATFFAERREGFQAGKQSKADFMAEHGAEAIARQAEQVYDTSERLEGQGFTTSERVEGQGFTASERVEGQKYTTEVKQPYELIKGAKTQSYLDENNVPVSVVQVGDQHFTIDEAGKRTSVDISKFTPYDAAARQKSEAAKKSATATAALAERMMTSMLRLQAGGHAISPDQGTWTNLINAGRTILNPIETAMGTEASVQRNFFELAKPAMINQVRQASGMSAKTMDSNTELKFYLSMMGGPGYSTENTLAAMIIIAEQYGLSEIEDTNGDVIHVGAAAKEYIKEIEEVRALARKAAGETELIKWDVNKKLEIIMAENKTLTNANALEILKQTPEWTAYQEDKVKDYNSRNYFEEDEKGGIF